MNIVLIALDTQRADHLGCYGYKEKTGRDTSPFLDSLAARGVVFEKCYAPNIPTHPSFTTMLTGKEAITHNIVNIGGGVPIKDGIKMIQEVLQENGYATGAVDTMGRHFSRGFVHYRVPEWDRSDPLTLRRAEHVTDLAVPLIEELKSDNKPFFVFLHYWDPHTPYLPPEPYRTMFYDKNRDPYDPNNHSMDPAWNDEMFKWYFHEWMPGVTDTEYVNALYDAETRYMDEHLKRVLASLESVQDDTLVVFTADHGEILDEQLGFYDHHGLYEGDVHVPLILFSPKILPAGKRVPGFVQNLDFVPTFLELAGLPLETMQPEGKSLLPCIQGDIDGNYDEVFMSEATWQVKRAIRNHKWKFIQSIEPDPHGRPMQELFDLEADPTEQKNLAEENPEVVEELKAKLDAWVAKRLQETGREIDPVVEQGRCGTRIGSPIEGETPGAGATPLHLRAPREAAAIPLPEDLNAGQNASSEAEANTDADENTGVPLHGCVDK
jgi:arylsulfatase